MQEMITSLTFNIIVKICFERFKICHEVVNVLRQLLFNVFIFLKENETTILQVLDKIDQILSKLLSILFFNLVLIFDLVILLLRLRRIAKKLLSLTNLCDFF
jgi:hypothetical protein